MKITKVPFLETPCINIQKSKQKYFFPNIMKTIFLKRRKPVGGVSSSQDGSQKIPLKKSTMFYKRNILSKHPQIAKKWVQSLNNKNSQIFLANFSNVDNFFIFDIKQFSFLTFTF